MAAAELGMADTYLRDRESGRTDIKLTDLLLIASKWDIDPLVLLSELLNQCDSNYWERVAAKLECTIPMAKERLATAQQQHGLTHGQVWALYLQEQIKL